MKKKIMKGALALMSVAILTGCGSSSKYSDYASESAAMTNGTTADYSYYDDYAYDDIYEVAEEAYSYDDYEMKDSVDFDTDVAKASKEAMKDRKLITTMNMSVETEEFDELIDRVEQKVDGLGGYVESSSVYSNYRDLREASYTIRVPEENLSSFVTMLKNQSNIISKSKSVDDVTLTYVDIESRKKVYETEMETLRKMLAEAEDVDTMLDIEMRLSDVQAEVESMGAQLRSYDNRCSFSTIYLNVQEVEVYTPVETKELTTWEKISQGFMASLEDVGIGIRDFFIGLVVASPYIVVFLIVLAIIITIIILLIKLLIWFIERQIKKSEKKKIAQQMMTNPVVKEASEDSEKE